MEDRLSTWAPGIEPLTKGGEVGLIRGIMSSERPDIQGEILRVDGVDLGPFLGDSITKGGNPEADAGGITIEHPPGIFNQVGEPIDVERGVTRDGVPALYLTSKLWVDHDPLAKSLWEKIVTINKASKRVRLGYSIDGAATQRNPAHKKEVLRWYVTNVVITGAPRNRDSWFDPILKSLTATPAGRDLLMKAANNVGSAMPELLGAALGEDQADANGLDIDPNARLTEMAVRLNLNEIDLAVAAALKGSRAWKDCLAKLMTRVAGR